MRISTYGDMEKKKMLLLPPMFTDETFFIPCLEYLRQRYFLIIPTYSGHYPHSTYRSMAEEEETLEHFFTSNQIGYLDWVAGFSLGGNIAFHYFCHHQNQIGQVLIDSAPVFRFPRFIRKHFYRKYAGCLRRVRENPAHASAELDACFHGMGASQQAVAPLITPDSLWHLMESCYRMDTPSLPPAAQAKVTFVYGSKDIARLCMPRLRKYKNSQTILLPGFEHCEFFRMKPFDYLRQFIE